MGDKDCVKNTKSEPEEGCNCSTPAVPEPTPIAPTATCGLEVQPCIARSGPVAMPVPVTAPVNIRPRNQAQCSHCRKGNKKKKKCCIQ